jgi:hypothetical protein
LDKLKKEIKEGHVWYQLLEIQFSMRWV